MNQIQEMVGSETRAAESMRRLRAEEKSQKQLENNSGNNVTECYPELLEIEIEKDKELEINIPQSSSDDSSLSENFEKLWQLYPKKVGKKNAFASYKKAIKEGATNKQIQDGIVGYKKHLERTEWLNPAHGSVWFNQERWNDEYDLPPEQQNKKYLNYNEFMKGAFGDGNNGT